MKIKKGNKVLHIDSGEVGTIIDVSGIDSLFKKNIAVKYDVEYDDGLIECYNKEELRLVENN